MFLSKFISGKYYTNKTLPLEFFFVCCSIGIAVILELLTNWDENLLAYLYHHPEYIVKDIVLNTMLAGFLFSLYSIPRFFAYKRLMKNRDEIEARLVNSQERLDIILDNSSTVIYRGTAIGVLKNTYVSRNVTSILGYAVEEFLMPQFWLDVLHPADRKRILASMEDFLKSGYDEHEAQVKHKNGEWRWIHNKTRLITDENGLPAEVVGSWFDITEKRQAEETIRQNEERFQLAVKASNDVIYEWNPSTNQCWVNEQHYTLFGYKFLGNNIHLSWFLEKVHPDDIGELERSIQETFANKKECWTSEYRFRCVDGSYASVFDRGYIVYDEEKAVRWIGTISDVTHLKKIELELRYAKEKAEDSTKAKSDFLANMSHEIRTPLNGIIGMTEMAMETGLSEQQRRYLSVIKSSSETLMSLVNDILDFSGIDAGKLELLPAPFSLRTEIPKSLQVLGLKASEKNLEFIFRLEDKVPDLFIGDVLRLQQIIMNLAGNAIKFTEKGEIILQVGLESATEEKAVLIFSLSDTGIGIPGDKLKLIFDEFTQVDSSTSRRYGGTGLGLSISRRLVQLKGGRLWAESTVGKGSCFHFTVPLKRQPRQQRERRRADLSLQGKPVLVVQGNATASAYSLELLQSFGMSAGAFHAPDSALAELITASRNSKPYSLVLLDPILAGDRDGFAFAREISNHPDLKGLPMIIVSMSQKASDREEFARMGFTNFLSKPFSPSDLLDQVQNLLANRKPHAPSKTAPALMINAEKKADAAALSVLLVEDNVINQEVAKAMLESQGFEVRIAGNGTEAINSIREHPFDVVLMDVQMPEMNGYEATQSIRQIEKGTGKHIHIIGLTANAMSGDREKCLEAGMDDYISKPMRLKDLANAITRM